VPGRIGARSRPSPAAAQAQVWDLATGEIHAMAAATAEGDSVRFPLVLGPYEAKLVVVGPLPTGVAAPEPSFAFRTTLAGLSGGLDVERQTGDRTSESWEQMGMAIAGPGTYRKQFTAAAAPAGKRVFLEIADAHEYARVTLNGKELEAHAWQPYRWEVTSALKAGSNELEIQVTPRPPAAEGLRLPRQLAPLRPLAPGGEAAETLRPPRQPAPRPCLRGRLVRLWPQTARVVVCGRS